MSYHNVFYRCGHSVRTLAYGDLDERKIYLKEISRYYCPNCEHDGMLKAMDLQILPEEMSLNIPTVFLHCLPNRDVCYVYAYNCSRYRHQLHRSRRGYKFSDMSNYIAGGSNGDFLIDSRGWYKRLSPCVKVAEELKFLSDVGFRAVHYDWLPPELENNLRVLNHDAAA